MTTTRVVRTVEPHWTDERKNSEDKALDSTTQTHDVNKIDFQSTGEQWNHTDAEQACEEIKDGSELASIPDQIST